MTLNVGGILFFFFNTNLSLKLHSIHFFVNLLRQIALKALSERLSQQADSGSSWPSLDDDSRPKTEVQAGDQSSPASNPVEPLTVAVEIDPSTPKPNIA
jgi:hypothetical protein